MARNRQQIIISSQRSLLMRMKKAEKIKNKLTYFYVALFLSLIIHV
ncbi:hypothetical protein GM3708_967 [Geminocystis sp. NIES-3708]|nr:hypothetical protein [Geminocystis sp. NIES-3708]BAQ60561.1 hypothetical protein GM3708_967 [Geminocystis sp. NIES-3708]